MDGIRAILGELSAEWDVPETVLQAFQMAADGGRVVLVGVAPMDAVAPIPITRLVRRGIQLVGSFGCRVRTDMPELISMAAAGRIDVGAVELRLRREILQVDQRASTTTPEIQDPPKRCDVMPDALQCRLDVVGASLSDGDKIFRIRRTAHAIAKLSRRQVRGGAVSPILSVDVSKQQPAIQPFVPLYCFNRDTLHSFRHRPPQ